MMYNINGQTEKKYRIGKYTFSLIEIQDLTKAWIAISVAFAILYSGGIASQNFIIMDFFELLLIAGVTVGLGFLLHEIGHKFMAQKYGVWAEFRANTTMLGLAIIMSFFGFIFLAPGAVMMKGHVGNSRLGRVAMMGPLINIILALIFGIFFIIFMKEFLFYGFMINAWLALFNMLPFGMFDGYKIIKWNKAVYGIMLFVSAVLTFAPTILQAIL